MIFPELFSCFKHEFNLKLVNEEKKRKKTTILNRFVSKWKICQCLLGADYLNKSNREKTAEKFE